MRLQVRVDCFRWKDLDGISKYIALVVCAPLVFWKRNDAENYPRGYAILRAIYLAW